MKHMEALTEGVVFITNAVHMSIGCNSEEVSPIFAVQSLRVLEVSWREGGTGPVLGHWGESGDLPRSHRLPSVPYKHSQLSQQRRTGSLLFQ